MLDLELKIIILKKFKISKKSKNGLWKSVISAFELVERNGP